MYGVLEQLPAETRTRLRSTQILTSLPQIVSELVQNALDAGARHVDVGVNSEEYSCWVRDDGCGMGRGDLDIIARGSDGGRYGSSKTYAPDQVGVQATFGFRGEALASAADLCCLEIASRTARSRECWSVILKDGKSLYNGPAVRWRRETPGTVVCVRDAFYNLPVRRRSHPPALRTLELIRQELGTYALVFPQVTFSLENTSRTQQTTSTSTNVFRIPAVCANWFNVDDLQTCSRTCIGPDVNSHPLAPNDLHRLVEQRFSASSFGKHALDEDGQNDLPLATVRRSPRKSAKKPVYVLNLTIPLHQIDNCLEPAKAEVNFEDRRSVTDLLDTTISSFLTRNGFRAATPSPRKRRKIAYDDDNFDVSPIKRTRSMAKKVSAPVYIPRASSFPASGCVQDGGNVQSAFAHAQNVGNDVKNTEHDREEELWTDEITGEVYIIDKRSGNSYRQNDERYHDTAASEAREDDHERRGPRRTLKLGHQSTTAPGETPSWIRKALEANQVYAPAQSRVRSVETSSLPRGTPDGQQEPSKALSFQQRRMLQEQQSRPHRAQSRSGQEERQAYQFGIDDLRRARVIAQVDCKFVACLMCPGTGGEDDAGDAGKGGGGDVNGDRGDGHGEREGTSSRLGLVLIDQHAADERVRVERYLRELCAGFTAARAGLEGVRRRVLDPPKAVLLTREERQQLLNIEKRRAFCWWGFQFVDAEASEASGGHEGWMDDDDVGECAYAQVEVHAVPEVVAEKLLLDNELRDLVKGYLAKLDEEAPPLPRAFDSTSGWLKSLRWCPRELVDLINSKACRGAIMFNDPLSIAQCEKLIGKLSETAFPFQCAHGRPSLVPLIDIGGKASSRPRPALDWGSLE
ncbi:hypothetical protein BD626DRAFT_555063 [Schizophyllum amplum]|uniref:MutL C-terminal dimerisation domain-containing protein n=1 Tax=Schizophyllum amplum TaxID=97359 RepID=A0A550CTV1_9AGAR|nr:hypothetical protein BD626DRAFT_555063 [Auriculariopsis ampla]